MKDKEPRETYITTDIDKIVEFLLTGVAIEGDIRWCDCECPEMRALHAADAIMTIAMNSVIKAFETLEIRKVFLMEYIANSALKNYCDLNKVAEKLELETNNAKSKLH